MENKENHPMGNPRKRIGSVSKKIRLSDFEKADETRSIILQVFIGGERVKYNLDIYVLKDDFTAMWVKV